MLPGRLRTLLFLVLAALFATACAGSGGTTTTAEGIVAQTTDGGQLAFSDLAGKPAVLWFWAPW